MMKRIIINTIDKAFVLSLDDVIYIKAKSSYSIFFMVNNNEIVSSQPLGVYDKMLRTSGFFRTHKSYLINISHIISIEKAGEVTLTGGNQIPVVKDNIKELISFILLSGERDIETEEKVL